MRVNKDEYITVSVHNTRYFAYLASCASLRTKRMGHMTHSIILLVTSPNAQQF